MSSPRRSATAPRAISGAPANLRVRELDAARALAARRAQLEAALDEIAAAVGAGGMSHTTARVSELMDLAPPGIDELFGVLSVVEARADYDVIVVDTAPTGHALRLLEMPDAAREWVQVLLRVLLKYRALVRPGQLAAELVGMSQFDPRAAARCSATRGTTRFVVVTRAGRGAASRNRATAARLAPAASCRAGRRGQCDDAGAGPLSPVPRDRRGRAPAASRSSSGAWAVPYAGALSSRPRCRRRRRAASRRSNAGQRDG